MGDLNVHHERWLKFSIDIIPEGSKLFSFCCDHGFQECIKKPTREINLLDLVLIDLDPVIISITVQPMIADHNAIDISFQLSLPPPAHLSRVVWDYEHANWDGLYADMKAISWNFISELPINMSCEYFTDEVLKAMNKHIPSKTVPCTKTFHTWINQHCIDLVSAKRAAEGSAEYKRIQEECSKGLFSEFQKHIERTRNKLLGARSGSKRWWKISRSLLNRPETTNSIPALRRSDRTWARSATEKAALLQENFSKKWTLPELAVNEYSNFQSNGHCVDDFVPIRTRHVRRLINRLRIDSATGPDMIPTRILKFLADILIIPITKISRRILATGTWPELWCYHWICPLYKKKSVYDPNNYRGLQITS